MLEFFRLIDRNTIWFYFILTGIALSLLYRIRVARVAKSNSIFTLERENANERIARSFAGLMIVALFGLGVFYLDSTNVVGQLAPPPPATATPTPPIQIPDTPTPPPLPTPTFTPSPTALPALAPTLALTLTQTPQVVATPIVRSQVGSRPACPIDGARITQPGNGARINGVVQIRGAATSPNFQYYKFEFRVPDGPWSFIERYDLPVSGGVLGSWNSDTVGPGTYELRLLVVDVTGNYPEPCVVRVDVQ